MTAARDHMRAAIRFDWEETLSGGWAEAEQSRCDFARPTLRATWVV
jgi:hypothetical protein